MSRPKRWEVTKQEHGIWEIKLSSWKWLHDYVHQQMLDFEHYVWRGQRHEQWLLEPTLDREIGNRSHKNKIAAMSGHLKNFKYAVRGRRGENPSNLENENDWWALGQHHGLSTPLLDWSHSPFVALYFAFHKNAPPQSRSRVVYAINPASLEYKSQEMERETEDFDDHIEFIRPLADENPRLVNQGGLFSRAPVGYDLEEWMKTFFPQDYRSGVLLKISIPSTGRAECLKTLNRMNINHSTLFPDIYGSSEHCNTKLRINKY